MHSLPFLWGSKKSVASSPNRPPLPNLKIACELTDWINWSREHSTGHRRRRRGSGRPRREGRGEPMHVASWLQVGKWGRRAVASSWRSATISLPPTPFPSSFFDDQSVGKKNLPSLSSSDPVTGQAQQGSAFQTELDGPEKWTNAGISRLHLSRRLGASDLKYTISIHTSHCFIPVHSNCASSFTSLHHSPHQKIKQGFCYHSIPSLNLRPF